MRSISSPGADRALLLPDLEFVLREPQLLVLDENVVDRATIESLANVRVADSAAIADQTARRGGEMTYIRFGQPELTAGEVGLSIELRASTTSPGRRPPGLGGMLIRFHERDGDWKPDEPILWAT